MDELLREQGIGLHQGLHQSHAPTLPPPGNRSPAEQTTPPPAARPAAPPTQRLFYWPAYEMVEAGGFEPSHYSSHYSLHYS